MKPRLYPALELTPEDMAVLGVRAMRSGRLNTVQVAHSMGLYHDTRDADLMYELTETRKVCGPTHAAIAHHMLRGQIATDGDGAVWINGHPVFLA